MAAGIGEGIRRPAPATGIVIVKMARPTSAVSLGPGSKTGSSGALESEFSVDGIAADFRKLPPNAQYKCHKPSTVNTTIKRLAISWGKKATTSILTRENIAKRSTQSAALERQFRQTSRTERGRRTSRMLNVGQQVRIHPNEIRSPPTNLRALCWYQTIDAA